MNSIEEYHLETRCLQLSGTKDPVYGFTSPFYVFSHDQVPLELADSNGHTVHTTGDFDVYDAIGKSMVYSAPQCSPAPPMLPN